MMSMLLSLGEAPSQNSGSVDSHDHGFEVQVIRQKARWPYASTESLFFQTVDALMTMTNL